MKTIGIDIGTSSICGVIYDTVTRTPLETISVPNSYQVFSAQTYEQLQDADRICAAADGVLLRLLKDCPGASAIGLSGQMHGILYLTAAGNACSPLYTWQDSSASQPLENGKNVCSLVKAAFGVPLHPGNGIATYFHHLHKHQVPSDAVTFCTCADYYAMHLTGRSSPLLHISMADSLGMFDVQSGCFRTTMIENCGGKRSFIPAVTALLYPIGRYGEIPVYPAIGDNQASFLGAIPKRDWNSSALLNYGTGGQISMFSPVYYSSEKYETRPLLNGSFLLAGCTLCAGAAYDMLERFFRSYAAAAGAPDVPQFDVMRALVEAAPISDNLPTVNTRFNGTRQDPLIRGSITNLNLTDFTPANLIYAWFGGMVEEIYQLYLAMAKTLGMRCSRLILSGTAARKNPALVELTGKKFRIMPELTSSNEDAACGAALSCIL